MILDALLFFCQLGGSCEGRQVGHIQSLSRIPGGHGPHPPLVSCLQMLQQTKKCEQLLMKQVQDQIRYILTLL